MKHFPASGGSIINISSIASENPVPNSSLYSATKGAVNTLAMTLAKELGLRNIRVNVVAPVWLIPKATEIACSSTVKRELLEHRRLRSARD